MKKIFRFILCLLVCQGAGALGALFTIRELPIWYAQLTKPSFAPPDWLFTPAWLILYTFMAISLFLLWGGPPRPARTAAIALFFLQLALNVAWPAVFFGLHSLAGGLVIIVLLWAAIAACILRFRPLSAAAAWLFVPYILWVSYAAALTLGYWWLNR